MDQMKEQAKAVGTDMIQGHIKKVDLSNRPFKATGDSGQEYTADSIIISTGAQARWLNLPNQYDLQSFQFQLLLLVLSFDPLTMAPE